MIIFQIVSYWSSRLADTAQVPTISISDLDDEALSRLVDDVKRLVDGPIGSFQADGGFAEEGTDDDVGKQVLMASLRKGYFSTEPVAVGVDGLIDADYGNRDLKISPIQQMTNSGYLHATNAAELSAYDKQERYKTLTIFDVGGVLGGNSAMGPLADEMRELREDDDVHSVSNLSANGGRNFEHLNPCAVDCYLKKASANVGVQQPRLEPDLRAWICPFDQQEDLRTPVKVYSPLSAGHTRILKLQPGRYGEEIVCDLLPLLISDPGDKTTMSTPVSYEALSYTWGDPSPRFMLRCNSHVMPVAHNLFMALQQIRLPDIERLVWIDALCINQSDLNERSIQVKHMLQIYQNATRVIVWLGEASDTSILAISSMKYIDAEREHRAGIMFRVHEPGCYVHLKTICDAQQDLLRRPWFTRSWIRQELSVARDVIVLCGDETVSWYTLKRSAARLSRLSYKLAKEAVPDVIETAGERDLRYDEDHPHDSAITYLKRGWIYGQPFTGLIGCIRSVWYYHAGGLLELLMAGRHFEATDPRDKVYAVLGMARVPMQAGIELQASPLHDMVSAPNLSASTSSQVTPHFPVDYSRSISEVYQDTVKYFINRDRNLDILTLLLTTRHPHGLSSPDLPSWVPDWRVPTQNVPLARHWDFLSAKLAATGGGLRKGLANEAELQSYAETGRLRAHGYKVDSIVRVLDITSGVYGVLSLLPEFEALCWQPERATTQEEHKQRGERSACGGLLACATTLQSLWLWLSTVAHCALVGANPTEQEVVGQERAPVPPILKVTDFDPAKTSTRLCETEQGWVCLAPAWVRAGDWVTILFGGRHPFVLRPQEQVITRVDGTDGCSGVDSKGKGKYQDANEEHPNDDAGEEPVDLDNSQDPCTCAVVGPCIVPNIMFGQTAKLFLERGVWPTVFTLV